MNLIVIACNVTPLAYRCLSCELNKTPQAICQIKYVIMCYLCGLSVNTPYILCTMYLYCTVVHSALTVWKFL